MYGAIKSFDCLSGVDTSVQVAANRTNWDSIGTLTSSAFLRLVTTGRRS